MAGWHLGYFASFLLLQGQIVLLQYLWSKGGGDKPTHLAFKKMVEMDGHKVEMDGRPPKISDTELHHLKEMAEKSLEHTLTSTKALLEREDILDEVEEKKIWVQVSQDAMERVEPETLSTAMAAKWKEESGVNCTKEVGHVSYMCESVHLQVSRFAEKAIKEEREEKTCPIGWLYSLIPTRTYHRQLVHRRREGSDYQLTQQEIDSLDVCERKKEVCRDQDFPPIDGWCNNLQHPEWGSANSPYQRMKGRSYYRDRLKSPYTEMDGYPSVRELSQKLMTDRRGSPEEDPSGSVLFAIFGQFIAHDITQAAQESLTEKSECHIEEKKSQFCREMVRTEADTEDHFFLSSLIGDPDKCNRTSMLVRSAQINGYPSYLILTQIYGKKKDLFKLRTNSNDGKMKLGECGDNRCGATPVLKAYHKLFLHEHNRIVDGLKAAGLRDASSDNLFQVARAIMIAQYQAIVYGEYLKLLLPVETYAQWRLETSGIKSKYTDTQNAGLFNEFTTAAFRIGHSQVPGIAIKRGSAKHNIRDTLIDTSDVTDTEYINFLLGASENPCHKVDRFMTSHLRGPNANFIGGRDLAAVNLARGRDHGLPPYYLARIWFRKLLGGGDIMKDIEPVNRAVLREFYKNAKFSGTRHAGEKLTDLWLGGLMEKHGATGKVGPLFAAIIGYQFHKLKFGDRYFFTHSSRSGGKGLLPELRRMISRRKLSDLICDNGIGVDLVRRSAFDYTSDLVSCRATRQRLDFGLIAQIINERGTLYNAGS